MIFNLARFISILLVWILNQYLTLIIQQGWKQWTTMCIGYHKIIIYCCRFFNRANFGSLNTCTPHHTRRNFRLSLFLGFTVESMAYFHCLILKHKSFVHNWRSCPFLFITKFCHVTFKKTIDYSYFVHFTTKNFAW